MHRFARSLDRVREPAEARAGVVDRDRLAVTEPCTRGREREVEPARHLVAPVSLVDEHEPERLEERAVRPDVGRHVGLPVVRIALGDDADGLARHVRVRRHPDRELAVEAEHELVGLVVVREEPCHAEAVDLAEAACAGDVRPVRPLAVDDVRVRAGDAEHPRAVEEQIADEPVGRGAAAREEAGGEGVRDDEVPVGALTRHAQVRVWRPAAVERLGEEERAVGEPDHRVVHGPS